MKLKNRLLIQTLTASFCFIMLLSVVFFASLWRIRNSVLANSMNIGSSAASLGAYALEEQVTDKIVRIAQDTALFLDEKFIKIENYTRTIADFAETIYTRPASFRRHPVPRVLPGQTTTQEPFIFAAPDVDLAAIRSETDLAGNIAGMLSQIAVVDQSISTSAIGSESGFMIAMDVYPWYLLPFDPRTSLWYLGAKERGDLYWTSVYADLRGLGPAISCAVPFRDRESGKFKGVARSTVMLSELSRLLHSTNLGRTGYVFILDVTGRKLFSFGSVSVKVAADGSIEGEIYLESDSSRIRSLGQSMTLGASGMMELDLDGVPSYAAYAPIHTLGWSLGVAIPVMEINAPAWLINEKIKTLTGEAFLEMNRNIILLAGFTAFMLLTALLAAFFFSVRFTAAVSGPILALNEGVREVSNGNLNREVCVRTGDELEQLASSFNTMTERLREQILKIAQTTAEQEHIATELRVARRIQISMLPRDFPPYPGRNNDFDLYAEIYPAKEVGGDFYDFFFIDDDHFALSVADVSGKGIPAALFMTLTKTLIRGRLQTGEGSLAADAEYLTKALETINHQLCGNNIMDMFVTMWFGVLEISSGTLFYFNAGHNPPLLKNNDGKFEYLVSPPDLFLAGKDDTRYHCRKVQLGKGATLFLYTDGITEASDRDGAFYGKERLEEFLNTQSSLNLRPLFSALRTDIEKFSAEAEQFDDITMIALRFSPPVVKGEARLILAADIKNVGKLSGFITENLKDSGCPEKVQEQIELAAEEIFVNIARYSYIDGSRDHPETDILKGIFHGTCEIAITVNSGIQKSTGGTEMTLSFTDSGLPFNPLEHTEPDINAHLEDRKEGGLGILIVKRFMDVVEYRYDGMNRLLLKKGW